MIFRRLFLQFGWSTSIGIITLPAFMWLW